MTNYSKGPSVYYVGKTSTNVTLDFTRFMPPQKNPNPPDLDKQKYCMFWRSLHLPVGGTHEPSLRDKVVAEEEGLHE